MSRDRFNFTFHICYNLILLFNFDAFANNNYHDILVNNKIVSTGKVSCIDRYNAFKPILKQFTRPFTFLDIGAAEGFFTFKTAYEFPHSIGVMIEGGYKNTSAHDEFPQKLQDLCKLNDDLNNIIYLRKQITVKELEELAKSEHFDVIFVFNILHHFKNNWKEAIDAILKLGDHVIFELPDYAQPPLLDHVASIAPTILGSFKHGIKPNDIATMRYYHHSGKRILTQAYAGPLISQKNTYIKSDFNQKVLVERDKDNKIINQKNWVEGINLCTFKLLNGVWPSKDLLDNKWTEAGNKDTKAWNIIIQGEKLKVLPNSELSPGNNITQLLKENSLSKILQLLPYKARVVRCLNLD